MLTLTFLGVGSAFAKHNDHSNVLIEAKGDVTGLALARRRLERGGVDPSRGAANVV